jgi:16S rRNA (adenine1518-N6/adenine1519-N6)-dimethyltransferase
MRVLRECGFHARKLCDSEVAHKFSLLAFVVILISGRKMARPARSSITPGKRPRTFDSRHSVRPKKSLGQNFLADPNIARNIVAAIDPRPGQCIVEIGPGTGAITGLLVESGAEIHAVEIDGRAVETLKEMQANRSWRNLTIHHRDFMSIDLAEFSQEQSRKLRLVGNLPYNITSRILFQAFEFHACVSDCVFMMQKEVAERIVSAPGCKAYGILSVFTRLHADPEIAFKVSPEVFFPKPKVWSSVVTFAFREDRHRLVNDYDHFRKLVKAAFGKRRKMLINSLKDIGVEASTVPDDLRRFLTLRPEQLSLTDFITLSNGLPKDPQISG